MRIVTSVEIEAPVERVWEILSGLDKYPEWNPFTTRVEGNLVLGEKIRLHVTLGGKAMKRTHVVSRVEANRVLAWTILTKQPWLMRGERSQTLEAIGSGRTRYTNDEHVEGLTSVLVSLVYTRQIRAGLDAVGLALKARAEESTR